jgi:hypothetical protein
MKKGKELKVKNVKNFNIKYGTVDNKNPKSIYINLSSWITPINNDELNYSRIIKNLDKAIRQSIYDFLTKKSSNLFYKDYTIVDFDLRKSGIKYNKTSYLSCEITLYLKNQISVTSIEIADEINQIINCIIKNNFNENEYFLFNKKKKIKHDL